MNDAHLRISDADRDRAAAALGEHYAQGRLTAEEHTERLDRIWAARTRGELDPVFVDLPGPYGPPPPAPVEPAPGAGNWRAGPHWRRRGLPTPLLVVLIVLLLLTVVTHLPLILVGLLVWCFLGMSTRRRRRM